MIGSGVGRRFFAGLVLGLIIGDVVAVRAAAATDDFEFRPLEDFRSGLSQTFDKQNQYTLLGGTLAFAVARGMDDQARATYAHQNRLGGYEWVGNEVLGTGVPGVVVGLGLWAWGWRSSSSYETHAGQAELEALLFTSLATELLKRTVNRERPDGSDHLSFPSGHTSTVAAAAQALEEFYGWKVGVPAYALTVLTAMSRVTADKHWLSDTVAGTVVGMVFAHSFAEAHLDRMRRASGLAPKSTAHWRFLPVFGADGDFQLLATRSF